VRTAQRIAAHLDAGAQVLEIAPGPGYLAIALAKAVPCQVTGLDISHSFVRIAAENARKAGVPVRFQQGDAADLPFPAEQFNFLVCRAAFKNFARPLDALNEMYRVLKAGGAALIIDLRKDYSQQALADYIKDRGRGLVDAMMMKAVFNGMLKRRAYTVDGMAQLVSRSKFMQGDIRLDRIGFELWLKRY
jgi:ubiquinone/menaquinone biosynthesis C-methylase UbiE